MIPYEIPIVSVTIPGVGEVPAGGLVVVVGPNSSGKTQLLRDINACVTGQARELVVCENTHVRKPKSFETFVQCLIDQGVIKKTQTSGVEILSAAVQQSGAGIGVGDVNCSDAQNWYNSFTGGAVGRSAAASGQRFLQHFGPMLSTALFLENRLRATDQTNTFDYMSQKPGNDLQAFYLSSDARDRLNEEVRSTFGKALGIDSTRHGILAIRVSDLPEPPMRHWILPDKVSKLRGIESEGDGLRSYCAVCIALLLGVRAICVIDEPEICLHPPQAHALGRFIGNYGTPKEIATFVATHSSQVLRGILETTNDLRIVRLVRIGGRFVGRLVDNELIKESLKRPAARSEVILDGVFADAVTIVEADGDRVAYQTAFELGPRPTPRDNYFAAVGGVGGMAETARFYRSLHIPVAVIADLD
ncbi:MAG: hypothetical protein DME23_05105 [Verrucomicrobia bacterium]|nr:MAG: hypothetical protein DME23_05105 [Verrucomicrobiota bacterium]